MSVPISGQTDDKTISGLDFKQNFGGINKTSPGLSTMNMVLIGVVVLGAVYLATRKKR